MSTKREEIAVSGFEKVVFAEDNETGMAAIVAIHSTALGPACGGTRMLPYVNREEALKDVLRLSKGMSYKSSLAGIDFGGGKSVLILDPKLKTPELFHSFGKFVDSFGGQYIAAQDMNITADDLRLMKKTTPHVLGIEGEPGSSGNPSPMTARGVFRAMEATLEHLYGNRSFQGIKIAMQGLGSVGWPLAKEAYDAGAELWVSDINMDTLKRAEKELKAHIINDDAIFDVPCDIFSPNAKGAILSALTINRLKCRSIVGAANNQLATEQDGFRLQERGILYGPDFAVNAGGIINIFVELEGYSEAKAFERTDRIYDTLTSIYQRAESENTPTFVVADRLAQERIHAKAEK